MAVLGSSRVSDDDRHFPPLPSIFMFKKLKSSRFWFMQKIKLSFNIIGFAFPVHKKSLSTLKCVFDTVKNNL